MPTHPSLRAAACVALVSLAAANAALGQTTPLPNPPPIAFEVASIKPSPPIDPALIMSGKAHVGTHIDGARVDVGYAPLMQLIMAAYKVKMFQVTGPSWLNTTFFDILAKLPEGATREQVPEMLQALLADRFKMTMHRENKEHAEFALVVAKGGAKLKEADPEPAADPAAEEQPDKPGEVTMSSDTSEGRVRSSFSTKGGVFSFHSSGPGVDMTGTMANGALHIEATRTTMKAFADMLGQIAQTPVVDKTELKGSYQLTLDFSLEELMAMARANPTFALRSPFSRPAWLKSFAYNPRI
jgi:uncharacterized protein (TIGR03435 family)